MGEAGGGHERGLQGGAQQWSPPPDILMSRASSADLFLPTFVGGVKAWPPVDAGGRGPAVGVAGGVGEKAPRGGGGRSRGLTKQTGLNRGVSDET